MHTVLEARRNLNSKQSLVYDICAQTWPKRADSIQGSFQHGKARIFGQGLSLVTECGARDEEMHVCTRYQNRVNPGSG